VGNSAVSNFWYCEEDDKAVGPLTLVELKTRLSQAANANGILVWREGMEDWQSAGRVPELIALITSQPPYLRDRSSPQSSTFVKSSDNGSAGTSPPKTKSKRAPFWYSLVFIALFGGGARFLNEVNRTAASVDLTKQISGSARDEFVKAGEATCLKSAADNKSLSLSRERLTGYCSCYMNSLADHMTFSDLKAAPGAAPYPTWLQTKIDSAVELCENQLQKGLLGG
jgi:hypothetical protein